MCGGYKGVASCVKNENPKAIYVHCCDHVLNLSLVDTAKEVIPVRNTLGTILNYTILFMLLQKEILFLKAFKLHSQSQVLNQEL